MTGESSLPTITSAAHKADCPVALYDRIMTATGDLRISSRGQMSLPAAARRRWRLSAGGEVGYLDLGNALLIVPGGVGALRRQLLEGIAAAGWDEARAGFGDPEIATE